MTRCVIVAFPSNPYQLGQCEEGGACAALGLDTATQQMAGYSEIVAKARDQVLRCVLHARARSARGRCCSRARGVWACVLACVRACTHTQIRCHGICDDLCTCAYAGCDDFR